MKEMNSWSEEDRFSGAPDWVFPEPWPVLPEEMKQFRLSHVIGKGSTGTVYHATQLLEYAVKVIPWEAPEQLEAACRDYEISKIFADSGKTVRPVACYKNEGQLFIVQELGEASLDFFAWRKCPLREVLQVLLETADALEYIQEKGYTHFDVKPQNIIIVNGTARIGDFSHCRETGYPVYEKQTGTAAFRAPEIVKGEQCSGKEDMYSLGITMYALLMGGRVPFEIPENGEFRRGPEDQIRTLFIHLDLLKIIQKAAAFKPEERFSSFRDFAEAIRDFMKQYADCLEEEIPAYRIPRPVNKTIPPFTDRDMDKSILS